MGLMPPNTGFPGKTRRMDQERSVTMRQVEHPFAPTVAAMAGQIYVMVNEMAYFTKGRPGILWAKHGNTTERDGSSCKWWPSRTGRGKEFDINTTWTLVAVQIPWQAVHGLHFWRLCFLTHKTLFKRPAMPGISDRQTAKHPATNGQRVRVRLWFFWVKSPFLCSKQTWDDLRCRRQRVDGWSVGSPSRCWLMVNKLSSFYPKSLSKSGVSMIPNMAISEGAKAFEDLGASDITACKWMVESKSDWYTQIFDDIREKWRTKLRSRLADVSSFPFGNIFSARPGVNGTVRIAGASGKPPEWRWKIRKNDWRATAAGFGFWPWRCPTVPQWWNPCWGDKPKRKVGKTFEFKHQPKAMALYLQVIFRQSHKPNQYKAAWCPWELLWDWESCRIWHLCSFGRWNWWLCWIHKVIFTILDPQLKKTWIQLAVLTTDSSRDLCLLSSVEPAQPCITGRGSTNTQQPQWKRYVWRSATMMWHHLPSKNIGDPTSRGLF